MIFKPIKTMADAEDYLSKEDLLFYESCRQNFSGSLLESAEKAVLKKARENQKRYEFFFEAGKLFAEHYKIKTMEEAKRIISPPPKPAAVFPQHNPNNPDNS